MYSENADELLIVRIFPFKSSVKASRNLSIVSVALVGAGQKHDDDELQVSPDVSLLSSVGAKHARHK